MAKRHYVGSLDGLRALCALGVIGYHMRLPWCGGGLLGVTILFVLSGYLTTAGLLREYAISRGKIRLGSFWLRRLWRLMPTVLVFVAVTGAVCAFADPALFTKMRGDILPAIFMVINWTKIFANESYFAAAGNPSPLTHFWSLAIEAQFYLVWPPILYFLMRNRVSRKGVSIWLLVASLASAILMAVLYVPGQDPTRSYYGTDTRAFSLLLGCWLAVAWPFTRMAMRDARKLTGRHRIIVYVLGPVCVIGLIAMMLLTEGYSSFSYYGGIALCSVVSLGAIAALVPHGSPLSRVLACKPLAWVGKRSYAIYLWHYPILELLNPLNATTGTPWWKLLLELVLILGVSELSYRFVEEPLRKGIKPLREAKAKAGRMAFVPALVVLALGTALTVYGLTNVKPVVVGGHAADEKRVMQASLKKPVQDGVYDVVLIGDSVSLGANEQLNAAFPHGLIDTRGERMSEEALEVLAAYVEQGIVGDDVVWSIGTNGVLDNDIMNRLLEIVGPDRQLWLVNLRTPNAKDIDNNALLDQFAAAHDNVHLVDWLGASEGHDDWFIEDGIHLTWDGRDAYAAVLVDAMQYVPPTAENMVYDVTLLGDSVALDAADALAKAFPRGAVDTAVGRTPDAVAQTLKGYIDSNVVGNKVVVAIGNEDEVSVADLEAIASAASNERQVWFVNVRTGEAWCEPNNKAFYQVAEGHQNVQVIDWYGASEGKDSWLASDKTHLSDEGIQAYADLISASVNTSTTEAEVPATEQ